MTAIIGPNGQDVFAVCALFQQAQGPMFVEMHPFMVEAVSREEALGKGLVIAEKLLDNRLVKVIGVNVSTSCVIDPDSVFIGKISE